MADIVLNIVTNVDDAASDLNKVKGAMSDVNADAKTAATATKSWTQQVESVEEAMSRVARQAKNAGKVSMDVSRNVASGMKTGEKAVTSFRQQARIMTQQLVAMEMAGKANTEEYSKMAQQLGNVRDAMGDAQSKAKFWADDARWITASTQAVQGLVGAYSLYAGIMGLVDTEDKELQKTMQKMQSLMVIMMGLTEVSTMLQKDSMVMSAKRAITEKLLEFQLRVNAKAEVAKAVAMNTGTVAAKAQAVAWKALNGAMNLNVFVAVAAAIVGIVMALKKFKESQYENARATAEFNHQMSTASEEMKKWDETIKTSLEKLTEAQLAYAVASGRMTQAQADAIKIGEEYKAKHKELTDQFIKDSIKKIMQRDEETRRVTEEYDKALTIARANSFDTQSLEKEKQARLLEIQTQGSEAVQLLLKKHLDALAIERKIADEREKENEIKKQQEKISAYDLLTKNIETLTKKIREEVTITGTANESDVARLIILNDQKDKTDELVRSIGNFGDAMKLAFTDVFPDDFDKKWDAWQKKLEATPVALDDAVDAADDLNVTYSSVNKALKLMSDRLDEVNPLEKAAKWMKESDIDDIIMASISGIAGFADKIAEGMTASINESINQIDKYISETDGAISEAQSRLDEQLRLQEEGSASNVAIEKKRLADLTEQREKYLAERKRQVDKERKIEQTMAVIKGAVAAIDALASGVSEGGLPGIIVGVLGAAAVIAEIATMYSQAESAIKFAHGNAEILGGNSHAGGGVSLGQYGEAEGGEFLGILSKDKTRKYGKSMLTLFDGINNSNDRKIAAGLMSITGNIPIGGGSNEVELKEVKAINGMYNIMKQPQKTVIVEGNKRIERSGRSTRIIYN